MNRAKRFKEVLIEGKDILIDYSVDAIAWLCVGTLGGFALWVVLYTVFSIFYTTIDLIFG